MSLKAYVTGSEFPPLEPGTMRIYSMRFCPFAERTRLVLEHKNIKYEVINIDLKQKPSWFCDKNPNGTVPTIEHDGKVLYESLVTCDYLDEIFPHNPLHPKDIFAKMVSCNYKFYKPGYTEEDVKNYFAAADKVEQVIAKKGTKFFGGDSVQMVDLMMWPHSERVEAVSQLSPDTKLSPERYPKYLQWIKTMQDVPAVRRCQWDTATHVHIMKSAQVGKPDYDYLL